MLAGYAGTLGSHGLDYQKRLERMRDLQKLGSCKYHSSNAQGECADYLLWDTGGQKFWQPQKLDARLEKIAGGVLYKFPQMR